MTDVESLQVISSSGSILFCLRPEVKASWSQPMREDIIHVTPSLIGWDHAHLTWKIDLIFFFVFVFFIFQLSWISSGLNIVSHCSPMTISTPSPYRKMFQPTSCIAIVLLPMMSRHMMMCSNSISWNWCSNGWASTTENRTDNASKYKQSCTLILVWFLYFTCQGWRVTILMIWPKAWHIQKNFASQILHFSYQIISNL